MGDVDLLQVAATRPTLAYVRMPIAAVRLSRYSQPDCKHLKALQSTEPYCSRKAAKSEESHFQFGHGLAAT